MFQNIKVDIIYYKTNTDFELEFNLCGCCRMRLLTDKASDQKSLVHYLARAVSRSRVILIAGALFSDDGIMKIVSNSIGKPMSEINNLLYGISGNDLISVIDGATPLVTPEGYFGGCIIESGPQSMILLTDNKTIRKSIMKTLIHPYIEELCALDLKEKAASASASYVPSSAPTAPLVPPIETASVAQTNISVPDSDITSVNDIIPDTEEQKIAEPEQSNFTVNESEPSDKNTELIDTDSFKADTNDDTAITEHDEQPEAVINRPEFVQTPSPEEDIPEVKISAGMVFESDDPAVTTTVADITDDIVSSSNVQMKDEDDQISLSGIISKAESEVLTDPAAADNGIEDAELNYKDGYFDDDEKSNQLFNSATNIPILIISIILLIVLAILCYCIFYVPAKDGVSASAYLHDTFSTLFG